MSAVGLSPLTTHSPSAYATALYYNNIPISVNNICKQIYLNHEIGFKPNNGLGRCISLIGIQTIYFISHIVFGRFIVCFQSGFSLQLPYIIS